MYNYYPTQPNRQPSFGLKGRPVSSLEEEGHGRGLLLRKNY